MAVKQNKKYIICSRCRSRQFSTYIFLNVNHTKKKTVVINTLCGQIEFKLFSRTVDKAN